jgi:hypothetical protein
MIKNDENVVHQEAGVSHRKSSGRNSKGGAKSSRKKSHHRRAKQKWLKVLLYGGVVLVAFALGYSFLGPSLSN